MIYADYEAIEAVKKELDCSWNQAEVEAERRKAEQMLNEASAAGADQNVIAILGWLIGRS